MLPRSAFEGQMLSSSKHHYNVLIAGGGPAGASLALLLTRRGYRCLVVDKQSQPTRTLGEALKPVASSLLHQLGLEPDLSQLGAVSTYVTRVHWANRCFEKAHVAGQFGPELHVDRARFDAWLQQTARTAGAHWLAPATIHALERTSTGHKVLLRAGERELCIDADYLVDASGRSASLSRKLGAQRVTADELVGYGRWYQARHVTPLVLIEATHNGWWYSAPAQPDDVHVHHWNPKATREHGKLVVLFITDPHVPAGKAQSDAAWQRQLLAAPATRERLQDAEQDGRPRSYMAGPARTLWTAGQCWLPVGDAALSFDPIAADGLCFALRSALEATTHITAELSGKRLSTTYHAALSRIYSQHLEQRLVRYRDGASVHDHSFWQRRLVNYQDAMHIQTDRRAS